MLAPVIRVMDVFPRKIPSKCEAAWKSVAPATAQTMFLATAPPLRIIRVPVAMLRVPAIWKIQARYKFSSVVVMQGAR